MPVELYAINTIIDALHGTKYILVDLGNHAWIYEITLCSSTRFNSISLHIKLYNYNYIYTVIKRPGVYFRSKSLEGAFKRGGRLIQEGVYCYVSSETLAQQQLLCSSWAAVSA